MRRSFNGLKESESSCVGLITVHPDLAGLSLQVFAACGVVHMPVTRPGGRCLNMTTAEALIDLPGGSALALSRRILLDPSLQC
jgi:hypothetical protein